MSKLEFKQVGLTYHSLDGETLAIKDVSFSVEEGKIVGIVGPSGCGKTTILSLIAGLLQPSYGEILINNKPIDKDLNIGYMLQHDQLFAWRTIWRNVTLGLELSGKSKDKESLEFAEELLVKYGLSEFKKSHPSQLSGGMRQRAALIRTLVTQPEILLLDEPFSALDFQTRLKVSNDVHSIIKNEGITSVFITHDLSEAISMSDSVIVLTQRPALVNKIIDLSSLSPLSPLERREYKGFSDVFEQIWSLLQ